MTEYEMLKNIVKDIKTDTNNVSGIEVYCVYKLGKAEGVAQALFDEKRITGREYMDILKESDIVYEMLLNKIYIV